MSSCSSRNRFLAPWLTFPKSFKIIFFLSFKNKKLLSEGYPRSIADGLLTSLGEITFPAILEHVNDIVTVSEANIMAAMRNIWERMKIVVEPSGAVPLGAVMEHPKKFKGLHVGIILSGGNVDLTALPW